ncbi:MAG: DUF4258 domain-containing protein [Acidobacteria bacterium]|nr:DUF4258 domain-containing protein [Acidobacteriota bacterium]
MTLTIEFIRQSAALGRYELSLHADDERLEEGLTVNHIEETLRSAELLEDYPDDPRGHSCLVLGYAGGQPVHLVCGLTKQGRLIIITVYRPTMPKWKDERTRNR